MIKIREQYKCNSCGKIASTTEVLSPPVIHPRVDGESHEDDIPAKFLLCSKCGNINWGKV